MSRKYFGTDGVRGRVGKTPITPDFAMRLGYAAGKVLASDRADWQGHPNFLLHAGIGADCRPDGSRRACKPDWSAAYAGDCLPNAHLAFAGWRGHFRFA